MTGDEIGTEIAQTTEFPQGWYRGRVRYVNFQNGELLRYHWGYIDQHSVVPEADASPLKIVEDEGIYIHGENCDRALRVGMEVRFKVTPDADRDPGKRRASRALETSESKLKHLCEGGIELLVPDRNLQDAVFFMSWCLQPSAVERVRELLLEKEKVMLLITQFRLIDHETRRYADEKRQLVSLDGKVSMASLSFNASGKHRVVARLVWGQDYGRIHDIYMSQTRTGYKHDVISWAADSLSEYTPVKGTGSIDVDIPTGLFAKKPFDYDFVNAYFKTPPKDQCRYFWYRRVPIYLLQLVRLPFMIMWSAINMLLGTIAAAILAPLYRGVSYVALLRHPYQTPLPYVWNDLRESRLTSAKQHWLGRLLLHPVSIGVFVVAAYLAVRGVPDVEATFSITWAELLTKIGWGLVWVVGVAALFLAALACVVHVTSPEQSESRRRRKIDKRAEKRRIETERRREAVEIQVRELICTTTGPRAPDPKLLGWSPRTIYFKVIDFKRKRCQNFSAA